jgi:hypothetical protein
MIYVGMFRNTFLLFREKEIDTRATLDPTRAIQGKLILV